jgi:hypothetical protein
MSERRSYAAPDLGHSCYRHLDYPIVHLKRQSNNSNRAATSRVVST